METENMEDIGISPYYIQILSETDNFDVTIICANGSLRAHRVVLSFISEFFSEILLDHNTSDVVFLLIPEVNVESMKMLLQLIYSGICSSSTEDQEDLEQLFQLFRFQPNISLSVDYTQLEYEDDSEKMMDNSLLDDNSVKDEQNAVNNSKPDIDILGYSDDFEFSVPLFKIEKVSTVKGDDVHVIKESIKSDLKKDNISITHTKSVAKSYDSNGNKKPTYTCLLCKRVFLRKLCFEKHCKNVHNSVELSPLGSNEYCDSDISLEQEEALERLEPTVTAGGETIKLQNNGKKQTRTFKCVLCKRMFLHKAEYKKHCASAHGSNVLLTSFKSETNKLNESDKIDDDSSSQMDTVTTNQKYTCDICDSMFTSMKHLQKHDKIHRKDYKQCKECLKLFTSYSGLVSHMNMHKGVKPYVCNICCKAYFSSSSLQIHKRCHSKKPYLCKVCGKSFSISAYLRKHELVHSNVRPHPCDKCAKMFKSMQRLNAHMKSHIEIRMFVCHMCGKSFKSRESLSAHERTHSTDRPFKCDLCNKAFKMATDLSGHKKIHSDVKEYKCSVCGMQFRKGYNLKCHMLLHTGERRFECEMCGDKFKRKHHLDGHIKTHNNLKFVMTKFRKKLSKNTSKEVSNAESGDNIL